MVEELLNLLPLDDGLKLVMIKTDKSMVIEAVLKRTGKIFLSEEAVADNLSYMIISSKCSVIEEAVNEIDEKVIRLTLKENKK